MSDPQSLIMTHEDFKKISALLLSARADLADLLEEELARATVVAEEQLPEGTVRMNSEVGFLDLDTNKQQTLTLVYPHDSDMDKNRISILAPIGAALIGLRIGQTIEWPMPDGKVRRIQVTSVSSQENATV